MVLITGGTGLVGSHLLYLLLREHGGVRATKRAGSDLKPVLETFASYGSGAQKLFDKIEWVTADITNLPQLTGAFAGIAHVYHAAACISFDPARYGALKKTNSEGTANIVNLCLANNIKKLCYVSSVITLGSTANNLPVVARNRRGGWAP
ncbi:MAG: NAD-dependent epimerase/dehydratase family protein, partial [Marinirhabdus sp.]